MGTKSYVFAQIPVVFRMSPNEKVINFLRNKEVNNPNFSIRKDEFTSFYAKHLHKEKKGNILHNYFPNL